MPFRGGSDMTWINDRNPAAINAMARAKVLHDAKKVHSHTYRGWTGGDVYRGLTKSEVDSILPKLSKEQDAWDEVNAYEPLPTDENVFERILKSVEGKTQPPDAIDASASIMSAAQDAGVSGAEFAQSVSVALEATRTPVRLYPWTPLERGLATPADEGAAPADEGAAPYYDDELKAALAEAPPRETPPAAAAASITDTQMSSLFGRVAEAFDSDSPEQLTRELDALVQATSPPGASETAKEKRLRRLQAQLKSDLVDRGSTASLSRSTRRPGSAGVGPRPPYQPGLSLRSRTLVGNGFKMSIRRRIGGLGTVTAPRSSVSRAMVPGRKGSKDAALYRKLKKAFLPDNMGWYYEPRRPGASNYIDAEEIKRARWGRPWRHFRSTAPHNLTHMIPLKVLNPRANMAVAPPPIPSALLQSQVHRISGMGKRRRSRSVHQRRVR